MLCGRRAPGDVVDRAAALDQAALRGRVEDDRRAALLAAHLEGAVA